MPEFEKYTVGDLITGYGVAEAILLQYYGNIKGRTIIQDGECCWAAVLFRSKYCRYY